ncbi:MAG: hypothetical protein JJ879_01300 [Sneathiella sp.]|nr:hypothetical protein [Sneathiella sp.]
MSSVRQRGARSVALLGRDRSSTNMLLRSMQYVCGVGEVECLSATHGIQVSNIPFMEEDFCILDYGGIDVELSTLSSVISGVDGAIVLCDPDLGDVDQVEPYLKLLAQLQIPTFLFVDKIDQLGGSVHDLFRRLEEASLRDLLLRQIPILEKEEITGYVDLASERAFLYQEGEATEVIELPPEAAEQKGIMRIALLEVLADYDDALMEDIMDDVMPVNDAVFTLLKKDVVRGKLVPVFLGVAEKKFGLRRLLKALRHEVPENEGTIRQRHILAPANACVSQVLATGCVLGDLRMQALRIWSGEMEAGMTLRQGGCEQMYKFSGAEIVTAHSGEAGEVVLIPEMVGVSFGDFVTDESVTLPHLVSLTET